MVVAIALGVQSSNVVYGIFMALPVVIISLLISFGVLPLVSVIALVPFVLGLVIFRATGCFKAAIKDQPKFLAMNVVMTLLTPFYCRCRYSLLN